MNNTIMVKGADFSSVNVGNLNLTKLTMSKANDYAVHVSGGSVAHYDPSGFGWDNEIVSSNTITVTEGCNGVYGRFNMVTKNANFNTHIATPTNRLQGVLPIFLFYSERDAAWYETSEIVYQNAARRPQILGYKQGEYLSDNYTAIKLQGAVYVPINVGFRISKFIFNWIKPSAAQCPEIGMDLPEIYLTY